MAIWEDMVKRPMPMLGKPNWEGVTTVTGMPSAMLIPAQKWLDSMVRRLPTQRGVFMRAMVT